MDVFRPFLGKEYSVPYKRCRGKLSYPEEKELELLQWVLEQHDLHLAVTIQNIVDQAVTVIRPINPSFKGLGTEIHAKKRPRHKGQDLSRSETTCCTGTKMTEFLQAVKLVEYNYPDRKRMKHSCI